MANSYIILESWMVNDLELKGNDLLIYAIIHGFTQNLKTQRYTGGLQYLQDWTRSSKQGVLKNLKRLMDAGLIEKEEAFFNGIKTCAYRSTEFTGGQHSLPGGSTEFTQLGQLSLPDNTIYNSNNNTTYTELPFGSAMSEANVAVRLQEDQEDNRLQNRTKNAREVMNLYNSICKSLPKLIKMTSDREKHINARLNDYTIDDFRQVFMLAEESDFLTGRVGRFKANFDWLITDKYFTRTLEGKYTNDNTSMLNNKNNINGAFDYLHATRNEIQRLDAGYYKSAKGRFTAEFVTRNGSTTCHVKYIDSGDTETFVYTKDTRPAWIDG